MLKEVGSKWREIIGRTNSHSALVAGVSTAVDKISLRALDATIQLIDQTIADHSQTVHS